MAFVRSVIKIDVPEMGGEIEQTSDVSDYRVIEGIKLPFAVKITNPMQTINLTFTKVELNKPIDDAMFSRPPAK